MQWLASVSVRRAVFATVLMLAVMVVGWAGYQGLGVDAFPKIDFPVVTVVTRLDGAAPEEVESEITDKLEEAVNTIGGIDELRSFSTEGVSQLFITFTLDTPLDSAVQDVRDHVSRALPLLPRGIDAPVISKIDPDAAPILYIAVESTRPLREITELADKHIRRDLENIPGVGQVLLVGGRKRQINVWLDAEALRAQGITAQEVMAAIGNQNLAAPGGSVQTGPRDLTVRVSGRVQTPAELGRIVIRESGDHPIRLQDVARVEDGEEEEQTAAILDGQKTLVLSLRKQSGENTVAVVQAVRAQLANIQAALPPGVRLEIVRDSSGTIQTQVNAVKEHLVLGALFAALIVLLFLGNVRSTIIAALAIPISIVGTFALMWFMGFTLNIITLLALALAVGIVIDDAIVVLENIFRFIDEKGLKPFPAAILATRDIGLAVLATTLSLLAVFLPVAFMSGIVGRFLRSFGLTMAFAICVSMLVSFSLTPMLAARWLRPSKGGEETKSVLERIVDAFYLPVERTYMAILRWSMSHRWAIVLACFAALGSCMPLLKAVPKGFVPLNDEANYAINIRAPEGTSLESTLLVAERIARETRRLPGVAHTLVTIGDGNDITANKASIYVRLVDPKDRTESQQELVERTRREIVSQMPKDLRIDVSDVDAFNSGQSTKAVQYVINGPDIDRLGRIGGDLKVKLKRVPGTADVDTDLVLGKPELRLRVLRDKAADLGVQISSISNAVQLLVGGLKASTFEENGEDYDIRMRASVGDRSRVDRLGLLTVPSSKLGSVPLGDLVTLSDTTGPSQINRLNRRREVTISSNVLPGAGESDIQAALAKIIADEHLPPGYAAQPTGRSRETGRAAKAFGIAFFLTFVFMYLVLAAQFESWIYPITIMLTLPLTVPFALVSLLLFHQAITIMSALGILVLLGVVKKNAILQVDHTNNLRAAGKERLDAILEANRDRLRPILMTTIAFVAGMLPLITSKGIGAGFNRATAGVVVGGQTLSLLLTLLAVPVFYSLLDDLVQWAHGLRSGAAIDLGRAELDRLDNVEPLRAVPRAASSS
ncbi:MAG TPA: efflux RND transporter permease subunit [Myxococcales bacterium]|nr:efflux RND transporter permease subunit [Myxococcales bacterium]